MDDCLQIAVETISNLNFVLFEKNFHCSFDANSENVQFCALPRNLSERLTALHSYGCGTAVPSCCNPDLYLVIINWLEWTLVILNFCLGCTLTNATASSTPKYEKYHSIVE